MSGFQPLKPFKNLLFKAFKDKKTAFTLAEVLITLGIIGIVAALTIPGLMQNIKGAQYRAKLKKTISTLNQAVRMNQAKYGFNFADTDLDSVIDPDYCNFGDYSCYRQLSPDKSITIHAIFSANLNGATVGEYSALSDLMYCSELDMGAYYIIFNSNTMLNLFRRSTVLDPEYVGYKLADGTILNIPIIANECSLPAGKRLADEINSNPGKYDKCIGYIDLDGDKNGQNREVSCSSGTTKFEPDKPCVVKNSDITDVYPIFFHDSTVEPATNAGKYVLNSSK